MSGSSARAQASPARPPRVGHAPRLLRGLASLVLLLASAAALAHVQASLDRTHVTPGESVQLTLERAGPPGEQADLLPLKQRFDIVDTSTAASLEIVSGKTVEHTRMVLTLVPRQVGRVVIPALNWGGDRSTPLTLVVSDARSASGEPLRKVFMETELSPPEPYVQAAVQITVRVFSRQTLYHPEVEFPATPAVIVRELGSEERSSTRRDGLSYDVLTRHYLAFPQHSGTVQLPGAVLSAQVLAEQTRPDAFARYFGPAQFAVLSAAARPLRLHAEPLVLNVRPRPPGTVGSYWIPATALTLEGQWSPADASVHAGDPLTLQVKLQATGAPAEQLPDVPGLLVLPAGLKAYPDQAHLDDRLQGDTVVGSREQSIALVADQPGRLTVPALHVRWWDTRSATLREAVLPARTLQILPAPAAPSASLPGTATTERASAATLARGGGPWPWIALAFALLWVATLLGWRASLRRALAVAQSGQAAAEPQARADGAYAARAFRRACLAGDAGVARRQLLSWVAAQRAEGAPRGLQALARESQDPELARLLRELDRACYTQTPWRGEALAAALTRLPRPLARHRARREPLEPLYP